MGIFTVALRSRDHWQDRDKAMMNALGRSLNLTLERTEQTRQLIQQRDLLDARTQLLSLANEDMEAFTYSVSHDLRTPVRHIHSFNDLLRRSLGPDIDAVSDRYLTVIKNASAHMNTLIDAMLDLSHSSQRPLRSAPVDLNALISVVRADLEPDALERQVVWSIAELPSVSGDRETLRQVLSNLLANALKYTRPRNETRIEIWAEDRGEHWAVLVRDNGVGFDPKYQHQLFGVFKRLHHERDFEGIGVGLATTRRIVLKHGGEMLAQGRPGEGATFGFTLPKMNALG
jgi:light-regulated signal transduction histidine kinase (bacteriophytochrome)